MRSLRVGVVGTGFGARVHVPAYRAQGRFEVVAIASPNRAAAIASDLAIPHAFASTDEMFRGVDIDVVSVASPPFDHCRSVLAALKRQKHVLCEKPLGINVAECEAMVDAAQRAGTVTGLAHEFRFNASRLALKAMIDDGELGALRDLEATFISKWQRGATTPRRAWFLRRDLGGGSVGAIFSHLVDLTTWLAKRAPVGSRGVSRPANRERHDGDGPFRSDASGGAMALIDYGDGLLGHVMVDSSCGFSAFVLGVHGTRRSAILRGDSMFDELILEIIDDHGTAIRQIPQEVHLELNSIGPDLPAFVSLLDAFVGRIDGRLDPLPSFEDGLATQHVLESVGYSAPSVVGESAG